MYTVSRSRLLIFTSASLAVTFNHALSLHESNKSAVCDAPTKNNAFVFIKPHANTPYTQRLVADTFNRNGIKILSEGELTGEQIDKVS